MHKALPSRRVCVTHLGGGLGELAGQMRRDNELFDKEEPRQGACDRESVLPFHVRGLRTLSTSIVRNNSGVHDAMYQQAVGRTRCAPHGRAGHFDLVHVIAMVARTW